MIKTQIFFLSKCKPFWDLNSNTGHHLFKIVVYLQMLIGSKYLWVVWALKIITLSIKWRTSFSILSKFELSFMRCIWFFLRIYLFFWLLFLINLSYLNIQGKQGVMPKLLHKLQERRLTFIFTKLQRLNYSIYFLIVLFFWRNNNNAEFRYFNKQKWKWCI